MKPFYDDGAVTIWHGDARDVLPSIDCPDVAIVDPPYGETALAWDRWVPGWPGVLASAGVKSMWTFGSMRMFLQHVAEFDGWSFGQDVVWEKHNGSGFHADRFKRVHEHATHWYRGPWADVFHQPQMTADAVKRTVRHKRKPTHHLGKIDPGSYQSTDDGPRLMRSVLKVRSTHGSALHPTEKPAGILEPLVAYSVPGGGVVLDPFAGSGSTLAVAKASGRRAVGIEADERYCEIAATRCAATLAFGASA